MSDKAIFLDRDDTLIEDPGYISNPDQIKVLDLVPAALIELKALGYKLIVVTNQSGVARGIVTEKGLNAIHDRLCNLLLEKGASLDRIYYCPYHPDGVIPKYRKESNDRKPNPGMLLTAAKEMDLDLSQSWCIGNSSRDIEAGRRAGCKTILIDSPSHKHPTITNAVLADYRGINLKEAVNIIKKHLREVSSPPPPQAQPSAPPETTSRVEPTVQENMTTIQETNSAQSPAETVNDEAEEQTTPPDEQIQTQPQNTEISAPMQTIGNQTVEIQTDKTERLLSDILGQLKSMQRADMFSEFSVMRLIAGIVQILVLFCLLIAIWFLLSPQEKSSSLFISLGFAAVFQLMSLSFYIMHGRK